MPKGSKIISAQSQNNDLCIWAKCDPQYSSVERHFRCVGTGREFPDKENLEFIATVQFDNGLTVVHLFERIIYERLSDD